MFSEDVEKTTYSIPQQYSKALRYIAAVKQKMLSQGCRRIRCRIILLLKDHQIRLNQKRMSGSLSFGPIAPLGGGPGGTGV
jgi:hypothetical protein